MELNQHQLEFEIQYFQKENNTLCHHLEDNAKKIALLELKVYHWLSFTLC